MQRPRGSIAPVPLLAGFAVFLVVIGWAVASSLSRPAVAVFEPDPPGAIADSAWTDTVTIDARDDVAWRYLDLDRNALLALPDTSGWDVAFRRHTIIAAVGAADLGPVRYDDVARAPAEGYVATRYEGDPPENAALRRWYDYRMMAHLLVPKEHVYVLRTTGDRHAKLAILGYYCPGPTAGCPTVRYTYPLPVR